MTSTRKAQRGDGGLMAQQEHSIRLLSHGVQADRQSSSFSSFSERQAGQRSSVRASDAYILLTSHTYGCSGRVTCSAGEAGASGG